MDRREIENYFIDCYEELSVVINTELGNEDTNNTVVENLLNNILSNKDDKKIFPKESEEPLKNAVGSEVLERLFSNYNLTYNKIVHGTQLTNLILKQQPDRLYFIFNELQDFLT